ncbi:MAG: nitroreductase [Lachnospiraceae bacterium]|nr:nitroreductase [Lachnospiraceae bacterium]
MTLKEAMKERHTVRRYTDRPIPEEILQLLQTRILENNEKYHLAIQLRIDDTSAFSSMIKLILAKGVKNFFILAGPKTPDLDEKLGYCSADLMLYAQTLGLNTWWVGGTFNKNKLNAEAGENKVIGVVAAGYGAVQGKPHKSKKSEEVAVYEGKVPSWYSEGVEAALLAPTALNKQAFSIRGKENKVSITCGSGVFAGADLGLVKYHFELGAGKENFQWENNWI